MYQPIDALQPERTEVNILTSARPLVLPGVPDSDAADRSLRERLQDRYDKLSRREVDAAIRDARNTAFNQWRSGITARNIGTLEATNLPHCGTVTTPDPTAGGVYEFHPVRTQLPHGCDVPVQEDEWEREAREKLEATLPFHVAREVWTGGTSGNPSLQSTAIDVSSAASVSPTTAAALLTMNYEECTQGLLGVLHVPSALVPDLVTSSFVERQGNRLVTVSGHVVSPGPGYPQSPGGWGPNTETDPDADPVYAEAGEGEAWMFMSSPVEFAGPFWNERQRSYGASHTDRQNLFLTVPEAWWVYRFETACVFAALAYIPT